MTPVLPLEISRKINNFLRPVEGFRLEAGQYHQCSFLYIVYITEVIENKNKLIIKGYKIFDDNEISVFEIITNKPKIGLLILFMTTDMKISIISLAISF